MSTFPLTSLANWSICSGFNPVYANMPICDVMCSHLCLLPNFSRFSLSSARIVMIRSAISLTSPSHCWFSDSSLRIVDAIRAPCTGGFEYSGRTMILI